MILILLKHEFVLLIFILMIDETRGSIYQATTIIVHNMIVLLAAPHTFAFRIE